ncbi:MAG: protein-export chaperone SecB [Burkholderiales bacterium]|jgi:preprotein translocase subunit SecB|nr:protein-export chaperone SecB [Burkholderiales bacterium]
MAEQQEPAAPQPQFVIEKIYVKDLSVEVPNAPQIFTVREQPALGFEFRNEGQALKDDKGVPSGYHEVTLTATVTAKLGDKSVFLIEASQSGIFMIRGIPDADMEMIYSITCPTILLPYLRETVSDVSVRAGFPPVFLSPMNFEALYRQQQESRAAPETAH